MPATFPGTILRFSRSRGFRVALLVFQFLWLNIIVPGHRRGIVSLPGTQCSECESSAPRPAPACCADGAKKRQPPRGDPAAHCAICFFSARLSPAVAVDMTHPPLELTGVVQLPPAFINHSPEFASTYLGRAPPVAIA